MRGWLSKVLWLILAREPDCGPSEPRDTEQSLVEPKEHDMLQSTRGAHIYGRYVARAHSAPRPMARLFI